MAEYVLRNAFISLNGVDVSSKFKSITMPFKRERLDKTTFGATTRVYKQGLRAYEFDAAFNDDLTDNELNEDLFALADAADGEFAVVIRPDAGSLGATNPEWRFTGAIEDYPLLAGTVGELAGGSLKLMACSAITRHVA